MRGLAELRSRPWQAVAVLVAWGTLVGVVARVMAPWFEEVTTYGFHDWDVETSFRYLARESLLRHGELPGWNPYACGGYPLWGYVEGATNVVSPWLPAYLAFPIALAIRVEAAGMALLGAVGAYAWSGAFTKSAGARLLVAALWAVNGRWGLQTASGHTWHLAYALMPWCLFFFERALARRERFGPVLGLSVSLAMLVYSGGIYPLPHTVLALGSYAALLSLQRRSLAPLAILAMAGLAGVGLAAPKLLPILHTFGASPRLIASTEKLDLGSFVTLLTHPLQPFYARPAPVRPYGWHEWGMYVSTTGALLLLGGVLFVEGARERSLKAVGVLFVLLGFGAFHPLAPWTLLHEHVPVFRSQHVPSRFLYPAVLLLAAVAAAGVGRFVERRRRRAPWLDLAVVLGVSVVAFDVASVAQQPMRQAMWMVPPDIAPSESFHFEENPPFHYVKRDWAGPMLLSMMANTGVLDCYGVPRPEGWRWRARPRGHPLHRGEVYLEGEGSAELAEWSPNRVRVALEDVSVPTRLVYNMHHWPGWSASVEPSGDAEVAAHEGLISVMLPAGSREVVLRYRPPGLGAGLALFALTAGCFFAWWRRSRGGDNDPAR